MMIWRSLSPKTLADVFELFLDRRERHYAAGAGAAMADGSARPPLSRTGSAADARGGDSDNRNG